MIKHYSNENLFNFFFLLSTFIYGGPISATMGLCKNTLAMIYRVFISTTNANEVDRLNVPLNQFIQKRKKFVIKYYHEEFINRFLYF